MIAFLIILIVCLISLSAASDIESQSHDESFDLTSTRKLQKSIFGNKGEKAIQKRKANRAKQMVNTIKSQHVPYDFKPIEWSGVHHSGSI